jgi:hypothetical protein
VTTTELAPEEQAAAGSSTTTGRRGKHWNAEQLQRARDAVASALPRAVGSLQQMGAWLTANPDVLGLETPRSQVPFVTSLSGACFFLIEFAADGYGSSSGGSLPARCSAAVAAK